MARFIVEEREGHGDWWNVLVDTSTGKDVASDRGEPEDQTFNRDWSWVAPLLNQLNERAEKAERERDEARDQVMRETIAGNFKADAAADAATARERERAARVCEREAQHWRFGEGAVRALTRIAAEIRKGEP